MHLILLSYSFSKVQFLAYFLLMENWTRFWRMGLRWNSKGMLWVCWNLQLEMKKMMIMILRILAVVLILVRKTIFPSLSYNLHLVTVICSVFHDSLSYPKNSAIPSRPASGFQFSKINKPQARYSRPWSPSPSMKSVNRNSCREVQFKCHTAQLVKKNCRLEITTVLRIYFDIIRVWYVRTFRFE